MDKNRDILPLCLILSLVVHAGVLVVFSSSWQTLSAAPVKVNVSRFELVRIEPTNLGGQGGGPGALGEPLRGEPGSPPRAKHAKRTRVARIAPPSAPEPATSSPAPQPVAPILEPIPKHEEQPKTQPAPISPTTTASVNPQINPEIKPAACDGVPASTGISGQNGTGEGGEGGTGLGGSPNGRLGGRGGRGGHGTGLRTADDWRPGYKKKVYSRIQSAKRYPYAARSAHMEGRVVVRFTVSRTGALESVSVVTPSPFPILNSDALAWVQRACPFPPFPRDAEESTMVFTYGLKYELTE